MRPGNYEEDLVRSQLTRHASIFACNEYAVISRRKLSIGQDECGTNVTTWFNDIPKEIPKGQYGVNAETNSYLNVQVFVVAWRTLISSGRVFAHDFTVKSDPDAVFHPARLRLHVSSHIGERALFTNCRYWGGDQVGNLFGALEVISKDALKVFDANGDKCMNLPWQGWGEDMFMQKCMLMLEVKLVGDFKMVGDSACPFDGFAPCSDGSRAAFHPFKTIESYWQCWEQSKR